MCLAGSLEDKQGTTGQPAWDRVDTICPLILRMRFDEHGAPDLAPGMCSVTTLLQKTANLERTGTSWVLLT